MFVALNRFSTTTPNSGDNGDSAAQQVNKRASGCQRNHSAKSLMALSSLVVLAQPLFTNQQKTYPDKSSTGNENDTFFVFNPTAVTHVEEAASNEICQRRGSSPTTI